MTLPPIVFSRPYRADMELHNLGAVLESGHVHGDGPFTASATAKLRSITGVPNVLLTTSGSHALELASLLLDLGPEDEVVMPTFTFPSAANAVALTGAKIVFVDIDPVTGNIDPELARKHVSANTRAISVVHYGGVAADMESLGKLSSDYGIPIIEDNAHGLGGTWRGHSLGALGTLAIQSFHDTKNVQSGEGGALLVNDPELMERAEMIREKGTNRSRFLRGQVDKYTWTEIGSSYLPSELNAAVLDSQLAEFDTIQRLRHRVWDAYADRLASWANQHSITMMSVPEDREHTAHLFFVLMPSHELQNRILAHLKSLGIMAGFHYVPLDTSAAGLKYGHTPEPCPVGEDFSTRLVRLPLWPAMTDADIDRVIAGVTSFRFDR